MAVSATRALRRATETGEPLHLPIWMGDVERRGGAPRRGQLVFIVGPPGSGKSRFILKLAHEFGTPVLYLSADQPAFEAVTISAAILTGDNRDTVVEAFDTGNGEKYLGALEHSRVHYSFDPSPTLPDIQLELDAWVETYDEYPEVIVVDNLRNIEGEGDKQSDVFILSEFKALAQKTNACVFVLGHLSEAQIKDPDRPGPRSAVINKVNELPNLMWSVAHDGEEGMFYIAIVKTREGKDDKGAKRPIGIPADFDRMAFGAFAVRNDQPTWGEGQ